MPNNLGVGPEDLPVFVSSDPANEEMSYVILDVKGGVRGRYATREEAEALVDKINSAGSEAPDTDTSAASKVVTAVGEAHAVSDDRLLQRDMHDTGVEHDQPNHVQHKEKAMPKGIPKKGKRAVKKRASNKRRTRTVANTVAKKTAKKGVKKTAKRRKRRT